MEIILNGTNQSLAISVTGYEFEAEKVDNEHDLNWLMLGFRYRSGDDERACTDPCLLTWEFKSIIGGLEAVLHGKKDEDTDDGYLLEPNLTYRVHRNGNGTFDVSLSFAPEGKMGEGIGVIDVCETLDERKLARMIAAMRIADRCFPERFGKDISESES